MLGFTVIGVLGTLGVIAGVVAGSGTNADSRLSSILTYTGWILLAVAAVIVLQAGLKDIRTFFDDFFPNAERREQTAAVAAALGLRSVARKEANVDMTFPFGDDVLRAATVFAGNWRGLDLQVFDCWRTRPGDLTQRGAEQWTCAILPIGQPGVELAISRQSTLTRIETAVGMTGTPFNDPPFDQAFRVEAATDQDMRLIDARVRSRLLEDTPKDRVAIEIEDSRMLYCCARIPIEERGALLEIAKRLRDAFEAT
jgi:hypothetical protein